MRILLTQEGLDAAADVNMLRVVADYIDPVRHFPGELWCEPSLNELNILGESVIEQIDPHYGMPPVVNCVVDQFTKAKNQPPRLSSYVSPISLDSLSTSTIDWSNHLQRSKVATTTFASGLKAEGDRVLGSWAQLAEHRHQSSFTFLVDPYLLSETSIQNRNRLTEKELEIAKSEQIELRVHNLERLLSEFIEPIADVPFTLLIVCKLDDPVEPNSDRISELKDRLAQVKSNLKGKGWNRNFQFLILRADRLSVYTDRLHDRYLLTQQYVLDSHAGFNCLTHPSSTKVDLIYHLANHGTHESFNIRFRELIRYVEACASTALKEQRKDDYFLSSGVLKDLPKTLKKRVKDSLGWEI